MAAGVPRVAAGRLTGSEVALAVSAVIAAYSSILLVMDNHATAAAAGSKKPEPKNYWGTLPSAWDHPEPNYVVSEAIGEFWSVVTTIPVAGVLLMYQGLKYGYGGKVMRIYAVTFGMYSLAFSAHLTLQKCVFSSTVVMVMSNALLTFAEYSYVVHLFLNSVFVRGAIVLIAEAALIATVATLPYALKANGGVWTLFVVQSPGVFLATFLATVLLRKARSAGAVAEQTVFGLVSTAGTLLSMAMVLSFVECNIGFEHGIVHGWWGFPWLHIWIHVFEQVGIYIFGVGVAALDALLIDPLREGAEVGYVGNWLVYLYCPYPAAVAAETAQAEVEQLHLLVGGGAEPAPEKKLDKLGSFDSVSTEAGDRLEKMGSFSSVSTEAGDMSTSPAAGHGLQRDRSEAAAPVRRRRSRHQTPPPRAPKATL